VLICRINQNLFMRHLFGWFLLWASIFQIAFAQEKGDPFLTRLYDRLHASPQQEKFRKIAPVPIGCVYLQREGEGEKEMRQHFRTMKQLGFNALKQIMTRPGTTIEEVQLIALEEGIQPYWYGEGGWETITPELLQKLKISSRLSMEEIRNHPAMQAHQKEVIRKRILKTQDFIRNASDQKAPKERSVAFEPEVGPRGFELSEKGKKLFVEWVKTRYKTIDSLNYYWCQYFVGLQPDQKTPFQNWEDFDRRWEKMSNNEYRHLRDVLRFKADHGLEGIQATIRSFKAFDPEAVFRGGGEMSLFYPHAWWCVDMESIARKMDSAGCFYPSMHLAWHYDEVGHELTRPFYMQASQMHDYFKGGWSAAIEATGGPQQFSGGKGGNGFTVDSSLMTQFIFSQLAAGFKGFGLWTWNARDAGWEAGEYALLDRNQKVTDRARKVGKIGKAMTKYRDELWAARKEPVVGILIDWDNDAMWAAMTKAGRDSFLMEGVKGRIGAARALMNANIPFEFVSKTDLMRGLAPRYKTVFIPAFVSVDRKLFPVFSSFVSQGGRLVMDLPGAYYDERSVLIPTAKGSTFEQLFGVEISDYQYSGVNRNWTLDGNLLRGMTADLIPTGAKVSARYGNGAPAITEFGLGKGKAVLLGYEAARHCFKPGNTGWEQGLTRYLLGENKAPYTCDNALVYRLAGPGSDHYFVLNDTPKAQETRINFGKMQYTKLMDAVTGEEIPAGQSFRVSANDGRWIRAVK
jgi:beta-galactosidase